MSCRARAPGLRSSVLPAAPRWPHKKEGAATGTCLGVEARLTHVARLSPHELFLKSRVHKVLLGLGGAGRGTEQLVTCHHTPSWRWRRRSGNGGRPGHGGTPPLPTNTPRIVAAVSTGTPAAAAAWRHGRRPSHWPTSAVATGPRTVGPPRSPACHRKVCVRPSEGTARGPTPLGTLSAAQYVPRRSVGTQSRGSVSFTLTLVFPVTDGTAPATRHDSPTP